LFLQVLVDLSAAPHAHALQLMALRPAPLQVRQWSRLSTAGGTPPLGYPAGCVV
jgi:predicted O-linked N-acetylglucosamine transferase (SPINDLY family)